MTAEERQEKLAEFLSFSSPELTEKEKQATVGLLRRNHDCFALEEGDIGITEGIEVEIEMEGARPIRQSPRRLAYTIRDEVKLEIEKLFRLNVVIESASLWASPIVAVHKKDGSLRLCVDYRKLNDVTHKDAFPLPRCEDLLNAAGKGTLRFITKLDLKTGFHQVPLSADVSRKTPYAYAELCLMV